MLKGDVIIEMGELIIHNIDDYMNALNQFNKGDEITIKIIRNGNEISLKTTF